MKAIPPALLAHLRGEEITVAMCWLIEKNDGTFIRGTSHDKSISIDDPDDHFTGVYEADSNISSSQTKSSSDASVDNMDVDGAMPLPNEQRIDVNPREIEGGLLARAPVSVLLVNWARPSDGFYVVKEGYLGEIQRTSDYEYKTEIRGMTQLLAQSIVRTYSERCQVVRFGDSECGFDLGPWTYPGTVTTVISRRRFNSTLNDVGSPSLPAVTAGFFNLGELTITSGANTGFMRSVKLDAADGTLGQFSVWDSFPYVIEAGATFTVTPGCDRLPTTCKRFGRLKHGWRGYGIFIPGVNALLAGPDGAQRDTNYGLKDQLEDIVNNIVTNLPNT